MLHFDFKARSPRLAKNALAYWYQNQSNLGLSMRQFSNDAAYVKRVENVYSVLPGLSRLSVVSLAHG